MALFLLVFLTSLEAKQISLNQRKYESCDKTKTAYMVTFTE